MWWLKHWSIVSSYKRYARNSVRLSTALHADKAREAMKNQPTTHLKCDHTHVHKLDHRQLQNNVYTSSNQEWGNWTAITWYNLQKINGILKQLSQVSNLEDQMVLTQ